MESIGDVIRPRLRHRVRARVVGRWHRTMESDRTTNILIFVLVIAAGAAIMIILRNIYARFKP